MSEREVVNAVKAMHSQLLIFSLSLLFSKNPISHIECFPFKVTVHRMTLKFLEKLLSLQ